MAPSKTGELFSLCLGSQRVLSHVGAGRECFSPFDPAAH